MQHKSLGFRLSCGINYQQIALTDDGQQNADIKFKITNCTYTKKVVPAKASAKGTGVLMQNPVMASLFSFFWYRVKLPHTALVLSLVVPNNQHLWDLHSLIVNYPWLWFFIKWDICCGWIAKNLCAGLNSQLQNHGMMQKKLYYPVLWATGWCVVVSWYRMAYCGFGQCWSFWQNLLAPNVALNNIILDTLKCNTN